MKRTLWILGILVLAGTVTFAVISCGGGGGGGGGKALTLWTMARSDLGADTYETSTVSGSGVNLQASVTPSAMVTTVDVFDFVLRGPYAYDPAGGSLYLAIRTTEPGFRIIKVNPDTGADTLVDDGAVIFAAWPSHMFMDSGSVWTVTQESGLTLRKMDPADGTVTTTYNVSNSAINALFAPATMLNFDYPINDKFIYDPGSGKLFAMVNLNNGNDGLFTVDVASGVAASVASYADGDDYKSLFWLGDTPGMMEVDGGYAGTSYKLSELDPSTGSLTELTTFPRASLSALFGADFGDDRFLAYAYDQGAGKVYAVAQAFYYDLGINESRYKELLVSVDASTGALNLLDSSPMGLACCQIDWYPAIWLD